MPSFDRVHSCLYLPKKSGVRKRVSQSVFASTKLGLLGLSDYLNSGKRALTLL